MKKIQIACALLVLAGLTGCASLESPSAQLPTDAGYDAQQVAAVENLARQRGVRVYWMQYPTKNIKATPQ